MNTDARERDLLTIAEAAMLLRCSAPTVRRKIATGELPAMRLGGPGCTLRIHRGELQDWLRRGDVGRDTLGKTDTERARG